MEPSKKRRKTEYKYATQKWPRHHQSKRIKEEFKAKKWPKEQSRKVKEESKAKKWPKEQSRKVKEESKAKVKEEKTKVKEESKSGIKSEDKKKLLDANRLSFKTCWKQSGRLWEAVEGPEQLLSDVAGITELIVTPAVKEEQVDAVVKAEVKEEYEEGGGPEGAQPPPAVVVKKEPEDESEIHASTEIGKRDAQVSSVECGNDARVKNEPKDGAEAAENGAKGPETAAGQVWTAQVRGKEFRVEAADVKEATKAVAMQVLEEDHGITQVVHRYVRPKKKPRRVTPIHVLREMRGQEIFFKFVQHWTKGDTEILTYEARLGPKTVTARGNDTTTAKNRVAMEALLRVYPRQLLDRVHKAAVTYQKLNLVDEHVTYTATVNGKKFVGRGKSHAEAMDNAAVRVLHSQYKAYLDGVCRGLAVDAKPLWPPPTPPEAKTKKRSNHLEHLECFCNNPASCRLHQNKTPLKKMRKKAYKKEC